MATDTANNIGMRRSLGTLGDRNFERSGTVQYKARRDKLNFIGTIYNFGDTLPFNVGGVSYSTHAMVELQKYWDQEWLTPLV